MGCVAEYMWLLDEVVDEPCEIMFRAKSLPGELQFLDLELCRLDKPLVPLLEYHG